MPPQLSPRDERLIASARARLLAGGKPTAAEQAAIDRQKSIAAQNAFLELASACPRDLWAELIGQASTADLRDAAERLDVRLTGHTIDVAAVLRAALPIVASVPLTGGTARTYQDLAARLNMNAADAVRQLKAWTVRGMPGRPGHSGRRDGAFPVEECRAWIATHTQTAALDAADEGSTAALRRRLLVLELEIAEREKLEQLARLADVNEIAGFAQLCVHNAKAVLEALPDEVLALLPADTGEAARKSIYAKTEALIDTALEEFARLVEGDTDPTQDEEAEQQPARPVRARTAKTAKRRR